MSYGFNYARFQEPAWVSAKGDDAIYPEDVSKAAEKIAAKFAPLIADAFNDAIFIKKHNGLIADLTRLLAVSLPECIRCDAGDVVYDLRLGPQEDE